MLSVGHTYWQLPSHRPAVMMATTFIQSSEPEMWSDREANGSWRQVQPPDCFWLVAISEKQELGYCNLQLLNDLPAMVRIQDGRQASKSRKQECVYVVF